MASQYIRYPNNTGGGGGTVSSINGAVGPAITIVGGTGISVGTVGNTITVTNTSPGTPPTGTANTFAGFDALGALESIPGFVIGAEGGMQENLTEQPNNGGGFTANSFNINFEPLQNSPNENWNVQSISTNLDSASSGFNQGTNGAAVQLLNLSFNHGGTGNVGGLSAINIGSSIGNGTDPISVKGMSLIGGSTNVNAGVTMDGSLFGFGMNFVVDPAAIGTSSFGVTAFNDSNNIGISTPGYISYSASPTISAISNNGNYNALYSNPNITTLTGNANAYGVSLSPTITTIGATGQVIGVNFSPNVTTMGASAGFQGVIVGGNVTTMGATSNMNGYSFNPNITTSHGGINGIQVSPTISGGDADFVGLNVSPGGASTIGAVTGLRIQLSNLTDGDDPQGATGIESDSRLQVNSQTQLLAAQGFQIGTRIANLFHIPSGSPVTGTDELNINIAGDIWAEDDVAVGGFGIGYNAVGFIGSVAVNAGKTIDMVTTFLPASAFPDPGVPTGGTITDMHLVRILPPLPQGGTATITNLYALKIDDFGATTFSGSSANAYGIYVTDTALRNHFGGSVDMGSLKLNGATSGVLTVNASAVTTSHTLTMPAAQGAASTVLTNNGSGVLSWAASGSGSAITSLTGDVTATGPGAAAATLATVNGNVGSFGSSTSIPNFTVNAKGLITAAGGNVVVAPAGTLSGTTLNSSVVTSSLTSVGTITSGTWNGTTIAIANGGTGQTTANAGFNALSPMTTGGDLIYGGASGVATRLANGTAGQVLQSNGTTTAPTWVTPAAAGANTALSNLASTAVNADIIPGTNNTIILGSSTKVYASVYSRDYTSDNTLTVHSLDRNAANSSAVTVKSGDSASPFQSGNLSLLSGDSTGGTGNVTLASGAAGTSSGAVNITAGTAGTTRGDVVVTSRNINLNAVNQISANSVKIVSLANPTAAQDAATKNYVDTTTTANPIYIKKDGTVAFTGDQSMGSHKLTNVTDPTSAQDAATKAYVDANAGTTQFVLFKDSKLTGTASGTFTGGAWQTRDLNTTQNSQSWASLSANQVTLNAGTYLVEGEANAFKVDQHQTRIRDITNSADLVLGMGANCSSSSNIEQSSSIVGTFTLAGSTVIELQDQCQTTQATNGFGLDPGIGSSNIFSTLKITKIS